ncbi:MAG: transporter substrate-binding domain-containing protein [Faecalibacterium sp.]
MKKISRRSFLAIAGTVAFTTAFASCSSSSATEVITSLEDLEGKKVGVQLGTTGDIYVSDDDSLGLEEVIQYNKGTDAVQALLSDIIDAVVIDDQVAQGFVDANPDVLTILDTAYAEEDYAACISKDNSELTAAFNEAIAELRANGTLEAILDKYINKTEGAEGYVSTVTDYPNGTLTMGTNAYFEPYEYYDGDTIVGVDAEFAKAICDYLGYDLVIEDMEFDSIIVAVNSGKVDFGMAGMTVTEERLENVDFCDSYCSGVQVVVVKK